VKYLLKHPYVVAARASLAIGGGLSLFLALFFLVSMDQHAALSPIINISIWILLSIIFFIIGKYPEAKLKKLKKTGIKYNAEISRLVPNYFIRIGLYVTVYAECVYINKLGQGCMIKSSLFLWHSHHDMGGLHAAMYVGDDPEVYAIEIFMIEEEDAGSDIDIDS